MTPEDGMIEDEVDMILPSNEEIADLSVSEDEIVPSDGVDVEAEEKERVKKILEDLVKDAYAKERVSREMLVRKYKVLNLTWTGNQYSVWDPGTGVYRGLSDLGQVLDELEIDPALYNRPVNVFRSWGESIIGALTTAVPRTKFTPKSMQNPDDISTARGFEKISKLIDNHNNPKERLEEIIKNLYVQGVTGTYVFVHEDEKYGLEKEDVYSKGMFQAKTPYCPLCGEMGEEDVKLASEQDFSQSAEELFECSLHGEVPAEIEQGTPFEDTFVSGQKDVKKRRVLIETYDGLNITIPCNSKRQKDIGFLICDVEIHVALAKALYPEEAKKIEASQGGPDPFDRWARASTEYTGNNEDYLVTYRRTWFRPWYYWMIEKEEDRILVEKYYPRGVKVCCMNDTAVHCEGQDLDDCWTLSYNPLNNRIYDYSIGMGALPIQEMFSELINLILMTIQYGVGETYADPEYFHFGKYKEIPNSPGLTFPAKMPPDRPLSDAFVQLKGAVLSKDAVAFLERLEQYGQLVTGAFPSIFGGAIAGGSGTAHEYETSKNQALQRVGLIYAMAVTLWHQTKLKACRLYRDSMISDESFTEGVGNASFEVFLEKSMLQGEVGEVLAESTEQFPVSWSQQRDAAFKLIGEGNQQFIELLSLPENSTFVKEILGFNDLFIPGNDDRLKQLKEISLLLSQEPIPSMQINPMSGAPVESLQSSIPVDFDVDNHPVEMEVCLNFLRSEIGLFMKEQNPPGYQNVLAHMKEHKMIVDMMAMQQAQAEMAASEGGEPSIQE